MVLFDSRACLDISLDIASGVSYMHMSDPAHIHGLLRASNVMLDSKNTAKVADVGMRSLLGECLAEAGTYPLWMAPEVLRGEPCSMASDVYAFGVLLYELWARREPYKDELLEDVVCDVARTPLNAMRVIWKRPVVPEPHHIPDGIIEIMEVCWHQDPARRPSIQASIHQHHPPGRNATPCRSHTACVSIMCPGRQEGSGGSWIDAPCRLRGNEYRSRDGPQAAGADSSTARGEAAENRPGGASRDVR